MGQAKARQMQEFEQGWQFVPSEHSACPACAKGEPAVVDFIVAAGSPGVCTYCSKRRRHTVATNDLLEFLFEGVASEYGQADAEGLPVAEGSYIFEPTDGDELLFWELGLDVTNASLREAIESATRESQWCNRDPLAPAPHQQSIFSWQRFSAAVKHDVRFLFKEHAPPADWYEQLDAPVGPGEILEHVGNLLSEIPSSFRTLEAGESVYRARWSASPEGYSKARDLTAPPPPKATIANRMSPPGISYFYGSLDEATALIETVGRTREERRRRRYGTVARWILTRSVPVLDLTADLELPSIFDPAHRGRRNAIRFVTAFRDEVSAQINPGTAAYEYVPTQILTEYVRLALTTPAGERVAGMMYPSAQTAPGANVVLFIGPEGCAFQRKRASPAQLVRLDRLSIRRGVKADFVMRPHNRRTAQP